MAVADLLRRDEADALVREAHRNVHRYPAGFPGVRARLRLRDERGDHAGRVALAPGREPIVELTGGDRDWAVRELASIADHRWHRPYERADGRWAKDVEGDGGPLGRRVHLDDPMLSSYWIDDGHIVRISRTLPDGTRLSIVIQDHAPAPDGTHVATRFTVTLQDGAEGALRSVDSYRDDHVERWGLLLPARRRVVSLTPGGSAARELVIDHHERLEEPGR